MLGTGIALVGLAAELLDPGDARVDVVDVEVHARPALVAVGPHDRAARVLGEPGHVVLGRAARILLELPAEEPAPELAGLRGVAGGNLQVDHLPCHLVLLSLCAAECAFNQDDERRDN